jgi:hypothetical protein
MLEILVKDREGNMMVACQVCGKTYHVNDGRVIR